MLVHQTEYPGFALSIFTSNGAEPYYSTDILFFTLRKDFFSNNNEETNIDRINEGLSSKYNYEKPFFITYAIGKRFLGEFEINNDNPLPKSFCSKAEEQLFIYECVSKLENSEIIGDLEKADVILETPECTILDPELFLAKIIATYVSIKTLGLNLNDLIDKLRIETKRIFDKLPNVGDIIKLGRYKQGPNGEIEPIEWIVLGVEKQGIILLCKNVLEKVRYVDLSDKDISMANFEVISHTSWKDSYLRKFLNNDFLERAFSEDDLDKIIPRTYWTLFDEKPVSDLVFCLSEKEFHRFGPSIKKVVKAKPTDYIKESYNISDEGYCNWWRHYDGSCHGPFIFSEDGGCCTDCLMYNDKTYIRPVIMHKL